MTQDFTAAVKNYIMNYVNIKEWERQKYCSGISSLSVLSARTGISWQDAKILSTHGVEPALWKSRLLDAAKHEKKTFFLTSGVADVEEIGNLLSSEFAKEECKNLKNISWVSAFLSAGVGQMSDSR